MKTRRIISLSVLLIVIILCIWGITSCMDKRQVVAPPATDPTSASPSFTPDPSAAPGDNEVRGLGVISTNGMNLVVRAQPSADGEPAGVLADGSIVELLKVEDGVTGWEKIRTSGGEVAYCRVQYVIVYSPTATVTGTVSPLLPYETGTPAPTDSTTPDPQASTTPPPSSTATQGKVTVTGNLNVRSQPSTTASVLGQLGNGAIVELVSSAPSNGWYQIRTGDGATGYVNSSFITPQTTTGTLSTLKPAATATATPRPSSSATTAPTANPGAAGTQMRVNAGAGSSLRVRNSPNQSANVVTTLAHGTLVKVVQANVSPGWHQIELSGGGTGYVSADFLVAPDAPTSTPGATTPPSITTPTPVPTTAPTGGTSNIPMKVSSDGSSVSIYSEASLESSVVATVADGTTVYVVAVEPVPNWHRVLTTDGKIGYIVMFYLTT